MKRVLKVVWYAIVAAALVNGAIDLVFEILMYGVER